MEFITSQDLNYIKQILRREPSKKEVKILYEMLDQVVIQRELLPSRYVDQLKKYPSPDNLVVHYEIRDVSSKSEWNHPCYLLRKFAIQGIKPIQFSFIWLFRPTKTCLHKLDRFEKNKINIFQTKITHHFNDDVSKKKSGKVIAMGIGIQDIDFRISFGQLIGWISIPKPGLTYKHEKKILEILKINGKNATGYMLEGRYGMDLRKLITSISPLVSLKISFPKSYKKGDAFVIFEKSTQNTLIYSISKAGYTYKNIGEVSSNRVHSFDFGDGISKKWPVGIEKMSLHRKNDLEEKIIEQNISSNPSKRYTLLNVLKKMIASKTDLINNTTLSDDQQPYQVMISSQKTITDDPNAVYRGIRSVTNVVRNMVCKGSKIDRLILLTGLKDENFLAGQQEAIHSFGLQPLSKTIFTDKLPGSGHIISLGRSNLVNNIKPEDNNFISLLGSLKGELANSLYQDVTGIHVGGNAINFNGTMEININQTIYQGLSSNIIKKVQTISRGGLSMALVNLMSQFNYEFGTKVHISSKLSEEELLFGESFGAAIVLLDEAKLMEFQKICMANGVSCSTIGRLQEKKELLVNDILKISNNLLR